MPKYKLGPKGANLIAEFESLQLEAYLDPVGIWTIGFGTTKLNGAAVSKGMKINEPVAWALLYGDASVVTALIEKAVLVELNRNQVDALTSFAYNIGNGGLLKSSLLTSINHKLIINEDLFTMWNKATINGKLVALPGLTRRRKAEYEHFISKDGL